MKVLIVDDEPLARARLKKLISDIEGVEAVGGAGNGKDAIRQVHELQPEIVLLDIRMPGMDGIEAGSHISALENPPAIIFTTAYGEFALDAFKSHAVDYLLKPVSKEMLADGLAAARRPTRAQLQQLDLFVLPSLFGEGMPMVVLEAMAMGVEVIATPGAVEGQYIAPILSG